MFRGGTWFRCLRVRAWRRASLELAMAIRTVRVELLRRHLSAVYTTTVASTCTLTVVLRWGGRLLRRRGSEAKPRHRL